MDNRLPSATDTSLRADLSRFKYYRNIIVHCNDALVDDTDFESYWNDVTPVIFHKLSFRNQFGTDAQIIPITTVPL
jgi:hypothetical protein